MKTTLPTNESQLPNLGGLRMDLNDSFTDRVMSQIHLQGPTRNSNQAIVLARVLYLAAAASILLFLGMGFLEYGSISMDNLLGLGGLQETDIYDYLDNQTYDY